jgi:hypothetical protein
MCDTKWEPGGGLCVPLHSDSCEFTRNGEFRHRLGCCHILRQRDLFFSTSHSVRHSCRCLPPARSSDVSKQLNPVNPMASALLELLPCNGPCTHR